MTEWQIAAVVIALLLLIIIVLLLKLRRDVGVMSVSNMKDLPQDIECAWEDVGDHGRFLTDLGGMSVAMREQMFEEFCKALNRQITGVPAAGSVNDVMSGMDELLTELQKDKQER